MRTVIVILLLLTFKVNGQWLQTWSDEFNAADGTGIDGTYWNYETGCVCPNSETVCYTNSTDNVRHDGNGNLLIIGKYHAGGAGCGQDYSSGRLTTQGKFNQLYGKWEARIKLPSAQGTWPAFWLLGEDIGTVGWPACGEIDIMETVWNDIYRNHGTGHMPGHFGGSGLGGASSAFPNPLSDDYHIYTAEWSANLVQFYVDGVWYANFSKTDANTGGTWAYDTPMFIILNIAIGGIWPGAPNSTAFPDTMYTDYIRVYDWYQDVVISGSTNVSPNETGTIYSVPYDATYSYTWSVPAGATITSGAGTNQITVDWGTTSGTVSVILDDGTYNATPTLDVTVSTNELDNPSFEFDYDNWNSGVFSAAASFNIDLSDPQHLTKDAQVVISSLGTNTYDIQLSQPNISLVNGSDYTLNFWAKGSSTSFGLQTNFILNMSPWTNYHFQGYTLSNTWQEYTFNFTSGVTDPTSLMTLDLSYNVGTYQLDNFYFGDPAGLLAIDNVILKGEKTGMDNRLSWNSFLKDVEAERSTDGITFKGIGDTEQSFYIDKNVIRDYYYRISFILSNKKHYSSIIYISMEEDKIEVELIDNSFISVKSSNETLNNVEVYNANGKLVLNKKYSNQIHESTIDFFDYQPGIYLVKINTNKQELVTKILKL